jgi:hypothetical protein
MANTIELTIKEVKVQPNKPYSQKFLVKQGKKIVAKVFRRQTDFSINFGFCSINSENFESAKTELQEFFGGVYNREKVKFLELPLKN